jgi:hypothetical protein
MGDGKQHRQCWGTTQHSSAIHVKCCLLLPAAIPQLRKPVHQIRVEQLLQLIIISPIKQEHFLNLYQTDKQTHKQTKRFKLEGQITEITLKVVPAIILLVTTTSY